MTRIAPSGDTNTAGAFVYATTVSISPRIRHRIPNHQNFLDFRTPTFCKTIDEPAKNDPNSAITQPYVTESLDISPTLSKNHYVIESLRHRKRCVRVIYVPLDANKTMCLCKSLKP